MSRRRRDDDVRFERIRRPFEAEDLLPPGQVWSQCRKKSRYATEHQAERYARKASEARGVMLRVYACGICNGFHLTHVNQR